MIPSAQIALLRQFVQALQANPVLLHAPEIAFFKEYVESLGAQIPDPPVGGAKPKAESPKVDEPMQEDANEQTSESAPPEEQVEEIPMPELDQSGVLTELDQESDKPLPMGDESKELTDEVLELSNEKRHLAMEKFSDGDFESAIQLFTEAIEINPHSAILHAKRAAALLKLSRPRSAIADCDKAIKLNPDAASGYKFRGRAHRFLGQWERAHTDLATACKLDYDDTAYEWLKEVEPNAKKLQEWHRAKERAAEERELTARKERVKKAQEARAKAQGILQGLGLPPGMADLLSDPEVAELLKDPEVTKAFGEIMQNPANLMKYMGNPKVQKLVGKFAQKGGAGGGLGGLFGGGAAQPPPPPQAGGCCNDPTGSCDTKPKTNMAPDPDVD